MNLYHDSWNLDCQKKQNKQNSAFLISWKIIFIFYQEMSMKVFRSLVVQTYLFDFPRKVHRPGWCLHFSSTITIQHHSTTQQSPTIQDVTTILYTFNQTTMCQTVRYRHRQQKIINLKILRPRSPQCHFLLLAALLLSKPHADCRLF